MNTNKITIKCIQRAIIKGDKFFNQVALPTSQRAGTITQRNSYALIKATKIFELHFKNKLPKSLDKEQRFQQMIINFQML